MAVVGDVAISIHEIFPVASSTRNDGFPVAAWAEVDFPRIPLTMPAIGTRRLVLRNRPNLTHFSPPPCAAFCWWSGWQSRT